MEELKNCPICGSTALKTYNNAIDYTVSRETFTIVKCLACNLHFTNPRPASKTIGKYYESEDYISHSNTTTGIVNKIYHLAKKIAINNKIKLIESLNLKNRNLLDIGCGTGSFLGEISKNKWIVTGIEPNEAARKIAISNFNLKVVPETEINTFRSDSFSVITLWHVLEHVHELRTKITEINNLLIPGGYAIIAVPNYTSWDAQHYKEYWAAFDVPRHLYHFSPEVIKDLFEKNGFTHYKSLPMKMDSFYVSMLSEKYKKSTFGIFKSLINGFRSNINAKNDAEKYSSVIYIFKK